MNWRKFDWIIILAIAAMVVLILLSPALARI